MRERSVMVGHVTQVRPVIQTSEIPHVVLETKLYLNYCEYATQIKTLPTYKSKIIRFILVNVFKIKNVNFFKVKQHSMNTCTYFSLNLNENEKRWLLKFWCDFVRIVIVRPWVNKKNPDLKCVCERACYDDFLILCLFGRTYPFNIWLIFDPCKFIVLRNCTLNC